jgi:hypothetical protein
MCPVRVNVDSENLIGKVTRPLELQAAIKPANQIFIEYCSTGNTGIGPSESLNGTTGAGECPNLAPSIEKIQPPRDVCGNNFTRLTRQTEIRQRSINGKGPTERRSVAAPRCH